MSPEFNLIVLAALGAFGWIFARWYLSEAQRVKRALAATPVTAVSALLEGDTVRVVGTLQRGPRTLTAPLSGRPCAVFLLRVRELRGKAWKEIVRESEAVEFAVDDGTGAVAVRPDHFELSLDDDHTERAGLWSEASDAVRELLLARGESLEDALGLKRVLQFHEAVMEEGERVAVRGLVTLETDPAPTTAGEGFRDRAKRKVLVPPADGAMLLSDTRRATG